jgi:hypothetical protein
VSLLNRLFGSLDFTWISLSSRGRLGSILLFIRIDSMGVLASSDRDYHIKCVDDSISECVCFDGVFSINTITHCRNI